MDFDQSLEEWAKDKPLSILQLDPADRAVLRVAGKCLIFLWILDLLRSGGSNVTWLGLACDQFWTNERTAEMTDDNEHASSASSIGGGLVFDLSSDTNSSDLFTILLDDYSVII